MTLYCDQDGAAYLVHSSDWNKTSSFEQLHDKETVEITFTLKNTGSMEGKQTTQLYIREEAGRLYNPGYNRQRAL